MCRHNPLDFNFNSENCNFHFKAASHVRGAIPWRRNWDWDWGLVQRPGTGDHYHLGLSDIVALRKSAFTTTFEQPQRALSACSSRKVKVGTKCEAGLTGWMRPEIWAGANGSNAAAETIKLRARLQWGICRPPIFPGIMLYFIFSLSVATLFSDIFKHFPINSRAGLLLWRDIKWLFSFIKILHFFLFFLGFSHYKVIPFRCSAIQ